MMTLDLSAEDKNEIIKILRVFLPEVKIVAFGSRVTEKARPFSDLDLCIMHDKKIEVMRVAELRSVFEGSFLPFRVDVVEWVDLSAPFKKNIAENHVVIQEGNASPPSSLSAEQSSHAQT